MTTTIMIAMVISVPTVLVTMIAAWIIMASRHVPRHCRKSYREARAVAQTKRAQLKKASADYVRESRELVSAQHPDPVFCSLRHPTGELRRIYAGLDRHRITRHRREDQKKTQGANR